MGVFISTVTRTFWDDRRWSRKGRICWRKRRKTKTKRTPTRSPEMPRASRGRKRLQTKSLTPRKSQTKIRNHPKRAGKKEPRDELANWRVAKGDVAENDISRGWGYGGGRGGCGG